mmetsp:Transcript_6494/g.29655  ORF Transcript_6494/g.29655 Transcript_6494/m.29655 type:complete len:258 (-) Transcript_6494:366-1139(-)
MIPFPEEADLPVASSVAPTALAAAASPSRLAASMSLTSAPPPSPIEARSQGLAARAAFAEPSGADASSPDSSSSSESATSPSPSTFARGGWLLSLRDDDDDAAVGAGREPSTLPGLDPSLDDVPPGSTSTTLETILGGARRALWGRFDPGGGRRDAAGGDRSRLVDRDWSLTGLIGGSSSESLCGGGGGANAASGDGDLARGGDGSLGGGEGSRGRGGSGVSRGGAGLDSPATNVSPARVLRTASAASPADAARASC